MALTHINGKSVGYDTAGDDGAAVLMLHGTTMNCSSFAGVCAAMPVDVPYRFVMMDLPGSGESELGDLPLTVDGIATDAHVLMRELGHERYHVVGFSIGAAIAAAVAANQTAAVRSATLMAGWMAADARMKATFVLWRRLLADPALFTRYALADGFTAAFHEMVAPALEMIIEAGAAAIAPGSVAQVDLDIALDITEHVSRINAPTLVIGGAEDRWVDVVHSHALGNALANARVEVLAAGHMMMAEQPALVAALLHPHLAAN